MRAFVLALCVIVSVAAFGQIGFQQRSYAANGSHLLTADFNHDGHTDLLEYGGPPTVLLNDRFGGFSSPLTVSASPALYASVADFTSVALAPGKYNLSIVAYEGNGAALKASE